jgi:hypothetical protein
MRVKLKVLLSSSHQCDEKEDGLICNQQRACRQLVMQVNEKWVIVKEGRAEKAGC